MKPLNRAERNSAFWRFLLLFVITITVLVAVIFFSIQVPMRDNKQLREKFDAMQKEKDLSDSINVQMKEAVSYLNDYDEKKERPYEANRSAQQRIQRMNDLLKLMPNGENSVYALIIQDLSDLNEAKKEIYLPAAQ